MCQLLVETVRWRGGMCNKHSDFGWVDFSWVLLLRRGRNTQQRVGLTPAHLHPAKTLYNGTRLLPTLEGGSAAETWRGLDNVSEQGFHRPLRRLLDLSSWMGTRSPKSCLWTCIACWLLGKVAESTAPSQQHVSVCVYGKERRNK